MPPIAPRLLIVNVPPFRSASVKLGLAGLLGHRGQRLGDLRNAHPVDVAHDRHDQAALGVDGHADVDVLLVDDLLVLHVDRGVHQRMQLERLGHGLHHEGHHRELDFGADVVGQPALANPLQLGDVGVVEIGDVRNRRATSGPC